jgi:DNA-binding response OmpR family regulator
MSTVPLFEYDPILVGMKVMLVDDNAANLDVLKRLLAPKGYRLSFAPNGRLALEIAQKNEPDLILLDIMMPEMDGIEVCKKLKEMEAIKDTPIIFITAKDDTETLVKGFTVGCSDYISKPFSTEEVLTRVRTQLLLRKNSLGKENLIQTVRISNDQIRARERLYRSVLETVSDIIFELDPKKKISFANDAFKLLGYGQKDLLGNHIKDFLITDDLNSLLPKLATKDVVSQGKDPLQIVFKAGPNLPPSDEITSFALSVHSFGIWNIPPENITKGKEDDFLGTLCIGEKIF